MLADPQVNGLCRAVLGENWCPCITYSATMRSRLENMSFSAGMCICGHGYSWHSAVPQVHPEPLHPVRGSSARVAGGDS